MSQYNINLDYFDLVYGYNKKYSKTYTEAVENTRSFSGNSIDDFKKVITKLAFKSNEVKDERITSSKGNIEKFEGYNNIIKLLDYIGANYNNSLTYNELNIIFNHLKNNIDLYENGYNSNISLIIDEYENAVYLLSLGILSIMSSEVNNDTVLNKNNDHQLIKNIVVRLANEITKPAHISSLKDLINMVNSNNLTTEGFVDALNNINTINQLFNHLLTTSKTLVLKIINSAFGIIPIVRSIIYLRLKKKVDTINEMEVQCKYIEQNIELLKNKINMDPREKEIIIQKQQAYIDAFKKRTEQLRAELSETEKDASVAANSEEIEVQPSNPINTSTDDEFSLESYGIKYIKESEEDDEPSYTIQHFKKNISANQLEESDDEVEENFEDIDLDKMEEGFVGKDNNSFIDEDENSFFVNGTNLK